MKERCLRTIIAECAEIKVSADGKSAVYGRQCEQYGELMAAVMKLLKNCREMPAFGVALDELTKSYNGIAVEFVYNERREYNGAPFEKLFVRLEPYYSGVNLERYHDGKYQGRCFYLNFEKQAKLLTDVIEKLLSAQRG